MDFKIVNNNHKSLQTGSYNKFKKEDIAVKAFEPFNTKNRLQSIYLQKQKSPQIFDPDHAKLTKSPSKYIKEMIPSDVEQCNTKHCSCPKYHVKSHQKLRPCNPPSTKPLIPKLKLQDKTMIIVKESGRIPNSFINENTVIDKELLKI